MESAQDIIIAGRFEEKDGADAMIHRLQQAGFPEDRYTCFFVSPPGHHDRFPLGGDRDESPGATEADNGALKGAGVGGAIGLGVGLAASPIAGPAAVAAGVGVGAYVGSLAGALNKMGDKDKMGGRDEPLRKSGFLVAARMTGSDDERFVARLFHAAGALEIERARGRWEAGKWVDFDPTRPPELITYIASAA